MENIVELESNDIVKDNIEKLKEIFPDIVKDGKIDFDTLKLVLGEEIETDKENYKFEWVGKRDCYKTIQTPSNGTLKYIEKDSLNPDIGENIIIEGDNLEVLKLLQSSYKNSIKMIYIDPPYNTGNDFIYPDNYETPLDNYLELTGQKINGETTQSKKSSEGRKHTQWLNMIFPRLLLSRTLLKEDGIICISIDDNEVDKLKMICNEIFGEENFIGEIIRKTKSMTGDEGVNFNLQHENLLIYSKVKEKVTFIGEEKEYKNYKNPDNDKKGDWTSGDPSAKSGSESTYFEIKNPFTQKSDFPPKGRYWGFSKKSFDKYVTEGKIVFRKEYKDNERGFTFKRYKNELESSSNPVNSLFSIENEFMNQVGTKELKLIFGEECFSNPKPILFIRKLIEYITENNDTILDFFGGSGTTGHSVLDLNNKEQNSNRKFILVQLPELLNPTIKSQSIPYEFLQSIDKPTNISEITKERIRRVINGYGDNPQPIKDGFKVFKLDKSNYKVNEKINVDKNSDKEDIIQKLRKQFRSSTVHDQSLVEGYNETDIIYENIIKEGYNLNSKIELVENIKEYKVYKITDIKNKKFYITFDKLNTDITQNKEFMGISNDTLFICFDHNLSDSDKSNLSKTFLLKTI